MASTQADGIIRMLRAGVPRGALIDRLTVERRNARERMVFLQEELDWLVYRAFGFTNSAVIETGHAAAEQRPFFSGGGPTHWVARSHETAEARELHILEDPLYKRPWLGRQGVLGHGTKTLEVEVESTIESLLRSEAEAVLQQSPGRAQTIAQLRNALRTRDVARTIEEQHGVVLARAHLDHDALPYLASLRLTDSGVEKHRQWCHVWQLQRLADSTGGASTVPVPPKYDQTDFRTAAGWRLRGKLDVPRERFISYPDAESQDDREGLFGWAGWDHVDRARALAAIYLERKDEDGWPSSRLRPLLAGVAELLPWLAQWQHAPDPISGENLATFFDDWTREECRSHGFSLAELLM